MTSVGCRSGVHWIRANVVPAIVCAIARARIVFAVPGHVLEQHVPAARERREDERDLLVLAEDDALDVPAQPLRDRLRRDEAVRLLRDAGSFSHGG